MLTKRNGTFYLALHVPLPLQGVLGKERLTRSLRTGRTREAREMAERISVEARNLWRQPILKTLPPDVVKAQVDAWLARQLQLYEDPLTAPVGRASEYTLDDLEGSRNRLKDIVANPEHRRLAEHRRLDQEMPSDPPPTGPLKLDAALLSAPGEGYADGFLDVVPGDDEEDGPEWEAVRDAAREILAGFGPGTVERSSVLKLRRALAGAFLAVNDRKQEVVRCLLNFESSPDLPPLARVTPAPALAKAKATASDAPLFSKRCAEYIGYSGLRKSKARRAAVERQAHVLLKILGDRPMDAYRPEDFIDLEEKLKRWPVKANVRAGDATVDEILSRKDLGPPLAPLTVTGYMTVLKTIFNRTTETYGIRNMAPEPPRGKRKDKVRFTDEQLRRLFGKSYFNRHRMAPSDYWIPLIALYSGMRVREICQLYVDDVAGPVEMTDGVEVGPGVWYFNVNAKGDKTTKNEKSVRCVPIHPRLVELGFLRYVGQARAAGERRLWPELPWTEDKGYSGAFVNSMSRYLKAHVTEGLPRGERPTFHGFRSTFLRGLLLQEVPEEMRKAIAGHSSESSVHEGYAGRFPVGILYPHLCKLSFPATDKLRPWK